MKMHSLFLLNKSVMVAFSGVLLLGLIGGAQADLSDGLVAHYPFDGDAVDVSGNGVCSGYV